MYRKIKSKESKYFIGIKLRAYPSREQKTTIKNNSNLSRFFYNEYVALGKEKYLLREELKNLEDLSLQRKNEVESRLLTIKSFYNPTTLERSIDFLKERRKDTDPQGKYLAKGDYDAAWNNYHKAGASVPKFKNKSSYTHKWSYSTDTCKIISNKQLVINKIGKIKVKGLRLEFIHEDLYVGKTKLSRENDGKYYISIQLGSKIPFVEVETLSTNSSIGIDLNLSNFYTDSNGEVINNPKFLKKSEKVLTNKQRVLSRRLDVAKKEGRKEGKNIEKARLDVAKIHKKIANQRRNFLHIISKDLIKTHDIIIAEDIRSSSLMKNKRLSKSIADTSWNMFLGMLEYKAILYNKVFLKVDPKYTTQQCNNCHHIMKGDNKIKLGVEEWLCPECNTFHMRDINAAKNILDKGLAILQV